MHRTETMGFQNTVLRVITILFLFLVWVILPTGVLAGENPDELYNQGRFDEAEKAYGAADMDHPKDTRYRYNRGCAAYQNSDYKGAAAAFSSVLKRAQDNETRFKSAYNLGNTAFKQGDLASATAHYKQAILWKPEDENAKYNLELALRQLQKQKQSRDQGPHQPSGDDAGEPDKKANEKKSDQGQEDADKPSSESKPPDQSSSQSKDQDKDKSQGQSGQDKASQSKEAAESGDRSKTEKEATQDLSGELKPMEALPEEKGHEEAQGAAVSTIDKKKAEALLGNIQEDRSKFLRFQVPEDKKYGVPSGKDW